MGGVTTVKGCALEDSPTMLAIAADIVKINVKIAVSSSFCTCLLCILFFIVNVSITQFLSTSEYRPTRRPVR